MNDQYKIQTKHIKKEKSTMEQNMEPNLESNSETKPKRKKGLIIAGVVAGVVVIAAAAFIGGRLFNQRFSPIGLMPLGGEGGTVSMAIQFNPAPELPTNAPEVTGSFAERQDNTIFIQTFSMDSGSGGGVVMMSSSDTGEGSSVYTSGNEGPTVEVVVTNDTVIYADITPMNLNPGDESVEVQQVVGPGNLDDLTTQTMVTVWGRKVGDRVIAEVIAYSNPVMIQAP
jgi:hypothetical protein